MGVAAALVLLAACGSGDGASTGEPVDLVPTTVPIGEVLAGAPDRVRVALGDEDCLDVLVADTQAERERGLMDRDDLGAADGMLFVWDSDVETAFYMVQTRLALDIGWFSAAGEIVDRTTMVPCPAELPQDCPLYESSSRYRYALELPAGGLTTGALTGCS